MGLNLYVFGNKYLVDDNFAVEISKHIKKKGVNIVYCSSVDFLLDLQEEQIHMLDVVKGINKVIIISDISQIKSRNLVSLHDFDLGFFLNLLSEMEIKKNIKIIGIPQSGDIKKITAEVEACL